MSNELDANVAQRLERVERENRRIKLAGAATALAFAGIALMGQGPPPQPSALDAKHFILRDNNGRRRVELTTVDVEDGAPYLVFRDKEERVRLAVVVGREGYPSIGFRDDSGETRFTLGLGGDGITSVDFWSKGGRRRAGLRDSPSGVALLLNHTDGRNRVHLNLSSDGSSSLVMNESQVMLLDRDGKLIWKAP